MKKLSLAIALLASPATANAFACNAPYETLECTNYNFSLTNFANIQPIDIDLGGGLTIKRFDWTNLTNEGYGICFYFGGIDHECIEALNVAKSKSLDTRVAALESGGGVSRTFNYPSRALNSCYQISSTKDSGFYYKVDVASGTLLSATATGTVTITSYTNSGCTTGAQVISDGTASQGAALGILSVSQIASVALEGMQPAGRWLKITTAQTAGTPTFSIRTTQQEVLF